MSATLEELAVEFDRDRFEFSWRVTPQHLARWELPPLKLLELEVQTKLEKDGMRQLRLTEFDGATLSAVWNAYRAQPWLPFVKVILTAAIPVMHGLRIDFEVDDPRWAFVSLPHDMPLVRTWHPAWLENCINHKLAALEWTGAVNPAQLRVLYARVAYHGERAERVRVSTERRSNPARFGKPFQVLAHVDRLEVEVIIGNVALLSSDATLRTALASEIDDAIWSMRSASRRSPYCRTLRRELMRGIDEAMRRPQALSVAMPLVLPGGFYLSEEANAPWLSSPSTLLGESDSDLLERRGVMVATAEDGASEVGPPRIRVVPVVDLRQAPGPVRTDFIDRARPRRAELKSTKRELQALAIAIPVAAAEKYTTLVERFWRELTDELGSVRGGDKQLVGISTCFALSRPSSARKPPNELKGVRPHDGAAWLPMLVREVIGLSTAPSDAAGIASALVPSVSTAAVKKALEMLTASGLISFDSYARCFRQSTRNILTGDDKRGAKIRRIHDEVADLGEALLRDSDAEGRWLGIALRCDEARFVTVKTRVRDWLRGLLELSGTEERSEHVFHISAQLFLS